MDSDQITQSLFGVPQALIGMLHLDALPGSPGHQPAASATDLDRIITREIGRSKSLPRRRLSRTDDREHARPPLSQRRGRPRDSRRDGSRRPGNSAGRTASARRAGTGGCQSRGPCRGAGMWCLLRAGRRLRLRTVADEGLIESDAGILLRYRQQIGAGHIKVFADMKKKHSSHAITADVSSGRHRPRRRVCTRRWRDRHRHVDRPPDRTKRRASKWRPPSEFPRSSAPG